MVLVGEEELCVVALYDGLDFLLEGVDIVDKLVMVFVDLLFVGELFDLGQEGRLAFLGCVGAHCSFRVETGRWDDQLFGCFSFVHGISCA